MKRPAAAFAALIVGAALAAGCAPDADEQAETAPPATTAPPAANPPVGPVKPTIDDSKYKTTPSGLKYREIKAGTGKQPTTGQTVSVHYTGKLESGQVFDSSRQRGEPITFPIGVGQVIPGWDEGVMMMKEGGRRELVIPSDLGYGPQGTPDGTIPPNATLIFDVELVDIK